MSLSDKIKLGLFKAKVDISQPILYPKHQIRMYSRHYTDVSTEMLLTVDAIYLLGVVSILQNLNKFRLFNASRFFNVISIHNYPAAVLVAGIYGLITIGAESTHFISNHGVYNNNEIIQSFNSQAIVGTVNALMGSIAMIGLYHGLQKFLPIMFKNLSANATSQLAIMIEGLLLIAMDIIGSKVLIGERQSEKSLLYHIVHKEEEFVRHIINR